MTRVLATAAMVALALPGLVERVSAQASASQTERMARQVLTAQLGTLWATAYPNFAGGQLTGCVVEFNVIAQDWTYKQGGFIRIGGSFALMSASNKLAVTMKVILNDIDLKTMNLTPSPPADAYFIGNNFTTSKSSKLRSINSDTPGSIYVIFQLEPTFLLVANGVSNGKVTIAFNRTIGGGSDIQVPIDTSVVETSDEGKRKRSPQTSTDFYACSRQLLQNSL